MNKIYTSIGTLLMAVILINCAEADLQVGILANGTGVIKKDSGTNISNNVSVNDEPVTSKKGDAVKKEAEKLNLDGKENSTKHSDSKDSGNKQKKKGSDVDSKNEEFSEKNQSNEADSHNEKKQKLLPPPVKKESFRGEECDSSAISCSFNKKTLVACLRVPGNESPELSLLIQNKGKGTLDVTITAPTTVQLETQQIQIQEQEDKKVKVAIKRVGTDNIIVLAAKNGNCSLDFKDLVVPSFRKEAVYASEFSYTSLYKHTPSLIFIILAALLLLATPFMCVKFRASLPVYGSKYQKLDMELPVSAGSKVDSGSTDGWDNSWGDDWDEEEATPRTPSMPVTPSLSSKGISSRRLVKDSWKD